jgi:hypothetical protein
LFCLVLLAALPARASLSAPQPTPPFAIQPGADPTAVLTKFLEYFLDRILAPLPQNVAMPRTELGLVRVAFVAQASQVPAAERPAYQWAIATCDAMSSAMDERDKAETVRNSAQAPTVRDVTDARGKGAKHVAHSSNGAARGDAAFLDSGSLNAWDQRATILRANIQALYGRVVAAEHPAAAAASPTAAPAPAGPAH